MKYTQDRAFHCKIWHKLEAIVCKNFDLEAATELSHYWGDSPVWLQTLLSSKYVNNHQTSPTGQATCPSVKNNNWMMNWFFKFAYFYWQNRKHNLKPLITPIIRSRIHRRSQRPWTQSVAHKRSIESNAIYSHCPGSISTWWSDTDGRTSPGLKTLLSLRLATRSEPETYQTTR